MFHSSPARWLAVFPAMATLAAVAQPVPASVSATPASAPTVLTYKSAFEGYRPFSDEKPIPWKEANDTVYRRGGWQAYAKEASSTGAATEAESPKGGAAAPAAPPGHAMPMPGMPGTPAKKERP